MNNILSKILCSLGIVFVFAIPVSAIPSDTTLLAGNVHANSPSRSVMIPASVSYPAALQNNTEQFADYVKNFSSNKREYLIKTYKKGEQFFPQVTAILDRYHLPQELKVLIALESGFNANVVSRVGAVGYWQLMNVAARHYGLHIAGKAVKDDRRDLTKSTGAAARYLSDMCKDFNNDILLIVAAYNSGAGNVRKAIKKAVKENSSFWDIKKYLPKETVNYVMNFIALNVIFNNYDNFISNRLTFAPHSTEIAVLPEISNQGTHTD